MDEATSQHTTRDGKIIHVSDSACPGELATHAKTLEAGRNSLSVLAINSGSSSLSGPRHGGGCVNRSTGDAVAGEDLFAHPRLVSLDN